MNFVQHPNHNCYMGAPRDWNEERDGPCDALSIHDRRNEPMPVMESCWAFEGYEDVAVMIGAAEIRLGVISQVHPPVYMTSYPKVGFYKDRQKVAEAYAKALAKIADHAKANGFSVDVTANGAAVCDVSASLSEGAKAWA